MKKTFKVLALSLALAASVSMMAACGNNNNSSNSNSTAGQTSLVMPSIPAADTSAEASAAVASTPEPSVVVPESSVAEPSVAEPSVAEPSVAEPSVAEPSVASGKSIREYVESIGGPSVMAQMMASGDSSGVFDYACSFPSDNELLVTVTAKQTLPLTQEQIDAVSSTLDSSMKSAYDQMVSGASASGVDPFSMSIKMLNGDGSEIWSATYTPNS